MASNRKYAGLPDLDQAPDIYETPELTDDNSTHPAQSEAATNDVADDGNPDISSLRLDPDAARAAFLSRRVDARDADFSDRLDSSRKSYRVSSRRRRLGEDDDDDDTETDGEEGPSMDKIKRRIARLQQEALEIRAAVEKRQKNQATGGEEDPAFEQESLEAINQTMKEVNSISHAGLPSGAAARLALRLGKAAHLGPPSAAVPPPEAPPAAAENQQQSQPSYTLTYQPNFSQSHALALAASFDTRLSALETALGLSSLPTVDKSPSYVPKPLLPSLDILEKQLEIVSSATPAFVDTLSSRLRQLTHDAEALDERRRLAKLNFDEMRSSARDSYSSTGKNRDSLASPTAPGIEDPEMATKINALYGTLPTIENLAPMLPVVVERLKSLRLLHQDAGGAKARLDECEERAGDMEAELKRWNDALKAVEQKMIDSEDALLKNAEVIEDWVKELEGRIETLNS